MIVIVSVTVVSDGGAVVVIVVTCPEVELVLEVVSTELEADDEALDEAEVDLVEPTEPVTSVELDFEV